MILPILSYGHDLLLKKCEEVPPEYPLEPLITDMWETLYGAEGCGLAASQIGLPLNLFLVDSQIIYEQMSQEGRMVYFEDNHGIRKVFINARIIACSDRRWITEEACLSLPGLQCGIERPWSITIEYLDETFSPHRQTFSGITARMIQHEFEHTQGILYLEHLKAAKRKSLGRKLARIRKGQVKVSYPMTHIQQT